MKILLDANISWKLTKVLGPIFGVCDHVDLIGLDVPADDIDIWAYAKSNGYIIITKDSDFVDLSELKGYPPKVVLLKTGNNSSKALAELLISKARVPAIFRLFLASWFPIRAMKENAWAWVISDIFKS
jgi:predicted nuclease of predicted toxin-antitoxin system